MYTKIDILHRISKLPQVLQDHIGSYNVEHRKMLKLVFSEIEHKQKMIDILEDIKFIECENMCGSCMLRENIPYKEGVYCDDWCMKSAEFKRMNLFRNKKIREILCVQVESYNVEHTYLMEDLRKDIECVECANCCGDYAYREDTKYSDRYNLYCSGWCSIEAENERRYWLRENRNRNRNISK